MNRIMIAGASSGVGKTTVSLGIMAALTERGNKVAPFKVGPDYIDPGFHSFVTGNHSHNLDSWLLDEDTLKYLFQKNIKDKDIGIIEGVMGLYDGFGIERDEGSSAHVSKLIKAPVVLVIDGSGMSTSAAALVLGYKLYDENLPLKGVILNKVSGEAHYKILKEAIERYVSIPCIGYLPSSLDITLKSRHLGLVPVDEVEMLRNKTNELAEMIEKYIDIDSIIEIAKSADNLHRIEHPFKDLEGIAEGLTIGVAMDKAFSFYYEDNLELLKEMGVKLLPFSPLRDTDLPNSIDGVYIGGGFPEIFGAQLEKNKEFRNNLKEHLEQGLPAYAECGGLMYLTDGIKDLQGNYYKMVGLFPTISRMTKRLQRFGYVNIETDSDISIRAHEFHHSLVEERPELTYKYKVYKVRNGDMKKQWKCGLVKANTLAAYPHIHFYSNPEFLLDFINKCKEYSITQFSHKKNSSK